MLYGEFMRTIFDLFPNAQVSDDDGELTIHTGLKLVHGESGTAYVQPVGDPNLTGV